LSSDLSEEEVEKTSRVIVNRVHKNATTLLSAEDLNEDVLRLETSMQGPFQVEVVLLALMRASIILRLSSSFRFLSSSAALNGFAAATRPS